RPVLGRAVWSRRGGIHKGLASLRFLSRAELKHAPDRGPDGGLRGDRRFELSSHGGARRRTNRRCQRRRVSLAASGAFHLRLASQQRLRRQPDVPALRHDARTLAGVVPSPASDLGTWGTKAGLATGRV